MESLYRKYRPLTFESVVGQQHIVSTLEHAVAERRLSHAYLFCGPRGTGKTTMARILAKALLCSRAEGDAGCIPDGTCPECEAIAAGNHPDVYELDAASRTGVDNVREEIINSVSYAPVRGAYKVYIIDEVHMLSTAAFNALLKTLEEPPAHVVFILCTTDPQKILETILSRCQRFDFHRISNEDIEARLRYVCEQENFTFDEEALQIVARHARGGMRDALSTLEQLSVFGDGAIRVSDAQSLLGEAASTVLSEFAAGIANRDTATLFSLVRAQVEGGSDLLEVTRNLVAHMRDVYTARVAPDAPGLLEAAGADLEAIRAEAQLFENADRLARVLTVLDGAAIEMRSATDPRLVLEIALTRLSRPESDLTLEALAERIEALEAKLAAGVPVAAAAPVAAQSAATASRSQAGQGGSAAPAAHAMPATHASHKDESLPWNAPMRTSVPAPTPAPMPQSASVTEPVTATTSMSATESSSQFSPAAAQTSMSQPASTAAPSVATQPSPAAISASVQQATPVAQPTSPVPTTESASANVSASVAADVPKPVSRPRPVAAEIAAAAAPATPAVTDGGELQRKWNEVVNRVKAQQASRGALLLHARAASDDGSNLVIELPAGSNFAMKMLERPDSREAVIPVVCAVFGLRVVEYRMVGAAASSQPVQASAVPAPAPATTPQAAPTTPVSETPAPANPVPTPSAESAASQPTPAPVAAAPAAPTGATSASATPVPQPVQADTAASVAAKPLINSGAVSVPAAAPTPVTRKSSAEDLPWSTPASTPAAPVPAAPAVAEPASSHGSEASEPESSSSQTSLSASESTPWQDDQVPYDDAMIDSYIEDEQPAPEPPAPEVVSTTPSTPVASELASSAAQSASAGPLVSHASANTASTSALASSSAAQLKAMAAASPFATEGANAVPQTIEESKQLLNDVFGTGVVFKSTEPPASQ